MMFLGVLLAFGSSGCTRSEPPADLVLVNGAEPDSLDPDRGRPPVQAVETLLCALQPVVAGSQPCRQTVPVSPWPAATASARRVPR